MKTQFIVSRKLINANPALTQINLLKKKKKLPTNKSPGADDFAGELHQT